MDNLRTVWFTCSRRVNLVGAEVRRMSAERQKVRFVSGDTECAAWPYPGTNDACVIMTGGSPGRAPVNSARP